MALELPAELEQRLEEAAEERGLSVCEFLEQWLDTVAPRRPATLADLARHAKMMNMSSPHPVNTSERSREILNTEYVDYLKSRIDADDGKHLTEDLTHGA